MSEENPTPQTEKGKKSEPYVLNIDRRFGIGFLVFCALVLSFMVGVHVGRRYQVLPRQQMMVTTGRGGVYFGGQPGMFNPLTQQNGY